jgi:glycyl-tRNA synthetase
MSKSTDELFKNVISHAKEYGFVFPSSEIYDGLSAVYDYGQNGAELKNNIKTYWWKAMVQMHDNIVGIDSAIFMHPKIWKASGHVDGFSDPMIDNKDSKNVTAPISCWRIRLTVTIKTAKPIKQKLYSMIWTRP